jgi:sec-independent protein translocase protein TatC
MNMCIFAAPMIVLYLGSIGVAYFVHPSFRNRKKKALNE